MALQRSLIRNFRSLAHLDLSLPALTVVFGPCGVGKSSFLDTMWFLRDCLLNGVDHAASRRDHGIGLMWDGAEPGASIEIGIETETLRYAVEFGLSAGRIDSCPGERLETLDDQKVLMRRTAGAEHAEMHGEHGLDVTNLRDPTRLSLERYAGNARRDDVDDLVRLLTGMRSYSSRAVHLYSLKVKGSETSRDMVLEPFARNLWSVLRNLKDRGSRDPRYDSIRRFMKLAFPDSFEDLIFEQTGRSSMYASMVERGRTQPIAASGISDGHLQMLIVLAALFAGEPDDTRTVFLDEPEISLHPWPLAVMAEAMREATRDANLKVIAATHSPVFISQFERDQLLVAEKVEDQTIMRWLSEISDVQDLLDEYAAGSIYMGQAIAPQGGQAQFFERSHS